MSHRLIAALENHLKQVPEDARARILLGGEYAHMARTEDALRELNMAVTLRANEALILYNAACLYCTLNRKAEALDTLRKAWAVGYRDSGWARRDPGPGVAPRRTRVQQFVSGNCGIIDGHGLIAETLICFPNPDPGAARRVAHWAAHWACGLRRIRRPSFAAFGGLS